MKVKEIRDTLGLTQVELANKLHVSETAVSRWENDHCQPDRRSKRKLENLLKRHKMKEHYFQAVFGTAARGEQSGEEDGN